MISVDEDALICDFAEYYHIYDFRALPVKLAATLACGLGDNSRIMKALNGTDCDYSTLLLAAAVDRLSLLWWAQTEDGQKNQNRPKSFVGIMQGETETDNDEASFISGDDFDAEYKMLTEGG